MAGRMGNERTVRVQEGGGTGGGTGDPERRCFSKLLARWIWPQPGAERYGRETAALYQELEEIAETVRRKLERAEILAGRVQAQRGSSDDDG
jgi:hypothetical protein